jgi:hypothetical protein
MLARNWPSRELYGSEGYAVCLGSLRSGLLRPLGIDQNKTDAMQTFIHPPRSVLHYTSSCCKAPRI